MQTLVLGLGNVLLRDEGVGVRVVERLQSEYMFPEEVTVLDGGTLGLNLLDYFENAARVVIVDAVKAERPPGTVLRLQNEEVPAFLALKVSPHQLGLQDLLALAQLRGNRPEEIVLWGIQGEQFDPGLEPTPAVAAQVPTVAARVREELMRWQIQVTPR